MKIIIFIGLKIVEILMLIFIPYFIGKFANSFLGDHDRPPNWVMGIMVLLCAAILGMLGWIIVTTNWEWAGKLID